MLNSDCFLIAFSSIERDLRALAKKGRVMGFSSLVDPVSQCNSIVRRYRIDLKEFADLRNAIVHERSDGHVIAEPNDEAVKKIEHIALLLRDPPKAAALFKCKVATLSADDPIARGVKTMSEQSFSQMPVYDGVAFANLLTANTIARWLGASVEEDVFSLSETPVSEVLNYTECQSSCEFVRRDAPVFDILQRFEAVKDASKRLEAVLITENGKPDEALLGIVTIWDFPKIYKALEKP